MRENILEYLNHWFLEVSPARKALDVGIAFLIAILGGALYLAYESESDLRRIAVQSLSRIPVVDRDAVRDNIDELFAVLKKDCNAKLVGVFEVDLSTNISSMIGYKGESVAKDDFERMIGGSAKRPFIDGDLGDIGLVAMGSLMRGDKVVCPDPINLKHTTLFVPIPDRSGSFLAGFIVVVWDVAMTDNTPPVNKAKMIVGEYSGRFCN